ncbi:hypothetical protein HPP92_012256 [Vanilla planifolia]|uniref:Uncharacterized protein n=1 Tax=Vanilla planifolia TaxID=51239 RepID=A0A835RDB3_VANPL|nr:hypothetical protein HPP92_012256 [Vanilla planifolia]
MIHLQRGIKQKPKLTWNTYKTVLENEQILLNATMSMVQYEYSKDISESECLRIQNVFREIIMYYFILEGVFMCSNILLTFTLRSPKILNFNQKVIKDHLL